MTVGGTKAGSSTGKIEQVVIERVDLGRYELRGILGTGADYEVRSAVDRETGQEVVLKRPKPQMVSRQLHWGTEGRTERILQVYQEVGHSISLVSPIIGYTDRELHDQYFGESLGQEYRLIVTERARGIPLVGDPMALITGVPIGLGQGLFTLFPLGHRDDETPFSIHQQLLDLEEEFFRAGYVLLDLRPQNVFFQPASGRITVIDCGTLLRTKDGSEPGQGRQQDIHDFYLEMLKFYTTTQQPPTQVSGYHDAYGMRPVVRFEQELDQMAQNHEGAPDITVRDAALPLIEKVRNRDYNAFTDFRQDLTAYLEAIRVRNQNLPNLQQAQRAWAEALDLLRGEHWRRYLFDPDTDLASFSISK